MALDKMAWVFGAKIIAGKSVNILRLTIIKSTISLSAYVELKNVTFLVLKHRLIYRGTKIVLHISYISLRKCWRFSRSPSFFTSGP